MDDRKTDLRFCQLVFQFKQGGMNMSKLITKRCSNCKKVILWSTTSGYLKNDNDQPPSSMKASICGASNVIKKWGY